ncbi:hypothetical protein Y032_0600g492 [Ancylostoma ceylanicum]|uniref:Uncharacterized protein n=1 Tax=Ancylostoma ceylanicum TaxID=53326 RepID=A0A016WNW9_9BILA|nr:hypothetical protein Y032_0600g492 [Ancylostoma ceylanicum]
MAEKLQNLGKDELGAFILMERIQPLVAENYLVRAMQPVELTKVVSELGVYGYALGDRGMPEVRQGGHLLRTKGEKVDEMRSSSEILRQNSRTIDITGSIERRSDVSITTSPEL